MDRPEVMATGKNQPLLINKSLSILVAMGEKNRPKNLAELENVLNVPGCSTVTPYINPFDALDIAAKLSDTDTQSLRIQNGMKYIYASMSEVDESVVDIIFADDSTHDNIVVPTEQISGKYYERITQRMCSWLSSNPEGEKQKLLDELATRAILEDECQPQEVVDNLIAHGIIQVKGEDVVYSFPNEHKMQVAKGIFESLTCTSCSHFVVAECWGCDRYVFYYHYDIDSLSIEAEMMDLRALMVLYKTPQKERPNNISDLLKMLSDHCKLTYVVPPSHIFDEPKFQKYTRVKNNKRRDAKKVTIGTSGIRVEDIQLTPMGMLGTEEKPQETQDKPSQTSTSASPGIEKVICQKALQRSQAMAERKESIQRRNAVNRGKIICHTFVKTANFVTRKRGSTLVEANREEKIEMIKNVENWVASFQDRIDVAEESQLPSLNEISQQLCRLCIGKVRIAAPSSLVLQLQKMGWLTISENSPYRVTYNLPITRKNAPWVADAKQLMKKIGMFYLPYLKTTMTFNDGMINGKSGKQRKSEPVKCKCPDCTLNQVNVNVSDVETESEDELKTINSRCACAIQ